MSYTTEELATMVEDETPVPCAKCGEPVGHGERVDVLNADNSHDWYHPTCRGQ